MKKETHKQQEHDEEFDPDEGYNQMFELYTMLPPFPFKKKASRNQQQSPTNSSLENKKN